MEGLGVDFVSTIEHTCVCTHLRAHICVHTHTHTSHAPFHYEPGARKVISFLSLFHNSFLDQIRRKHERVLKSLKCRIQTIHFIVV